MFHDSLALRVTDVSALVGELFSLTAFNNVSFHCIFDILTVICYGDLFLWSCLFGVLDASFIWMSDSFPRLVKISSIFCWLYLLCF